MKLLIPILFFLSVGHAQPAENELSFHLTCPEVSAECQEIIFAGSESEKIIIKKDAEIAVTREEIAGAGIYLNEHDQQEIRLTFSPSTRKKISELTSHGLPKKLVLVAQGQALIAPMVNAPINGSTLSISGAGDTKKLAALIPGLEDWQEGASTGFEAISWFLPFWIGAFFVGGAGFLWFTRKRRKK